MTATYRSNNIAADIKRIIPARLAAERYGFTPSRAGYICCPFHMEKTGSLKFFNDGGWHCFGCGRGGSSIDFVMELFGIDFRQAIVRLDMDFFAEFNLRKTSPHRSVRHTGTTPKTAVTPPGTGNGNSESVPGTPPTARESAGLPPGRQSGLSPPVCRSGKTSVGGAVQAGRAGK